MSEKFVHLVCSKYTQSYFEGKMGLGSYELNKDLIISLNISHNLFPSFWNFLNFSLYESNLPLTQPFFLLLTLHTLFQLSYIFLAAITFCTNTPKKDDMSLI